MDIVRGLLRRRPDLNIVRAQEAGLSGASDETVLAWAAREGRVLVTNDVTTLTRSAYERVARGEPMPGVFAVTRRATVASVIDDLLVLADCSLDGEWVGQVRYLPL